MFVLDSKLFQAMFKKYLNIFPKEPKNRDYFQRLSNLVMASTIRRYIFKCNT